MKNIDLRSRRVAVATIVAVVGVLATLATSITAVVKDAHAIGQIKKLNDQSVFYANEKFLTLQNDLVINFQEISQIFQTHRKYVGARISDFNDYVISEHIRQCESEVLTVLTGGMPLAKDWVKDFDALCRKVNSRQFCSKIAISDYVGLENPEFFINSVSNNLELHLDLSLPIETENFSSEPLMLYNSQNIGFYSGSNFVKLMVPENFLVRVVKDSYTGFYSREIIEIKQSCQRSVCQSKSLVVNDKCHCISSILDGHFSECSYSILENESPCDLIPLQGEGVLVTAENAVFREKSDLFEQKELKITNDTKIIKKAGQLICYRNGLSTVHNINSKIDVEYNSFKKNVQIFEKEANLTDLNEIQNRFQKIQNRVVDLEKFNQREFTQVAGNSVTYESFFNGIFIICVFFFFLSLFIMMYKRFERKFLLSFD